MLYNRFKVGFDKKYLMQREDKAKVEQIQISGSFGSRSNLSPGSRSVYIKCKNISICSTMSTNKNREKIVDIAEGISVIVWGRIQYFSSSESRIQWIRGRIPNPGCVAQQVSSLRFLASRYHCPIEIGPDCSWKSVCTPPAVGVSM